MRSWTAWFLLFAAAVVGPHLYLRSQAMAEVETARAGLERQAAALEVPPSLSIPAEENSALVALEAADVLPADWVMVSPFHGQCGQRSTARCKSLA